MSLVVQKFGGTSVMDAVAIDRTAQIVKGRLGQTPLVVVSVRRWQGADATAAAEAGAAADALDAIREAIALQELGAFAVVLECIPATLGAEITAALRIPTIGIGAGAACDGQILVLQDLLGMNIDKTPKFVRRFVDGARCVTDSIARFDAAVKAGTFPAAEESYQ